MRRALRINAYFTMLLLCILVLLLSIYSYSIFAIKKEEAKITLESHLAKVERLIDSIVDKIKLEIQNIPDFLSESNDQTNSKENNVQNREAIFYWINCDTQNCIKENDTILSFSYIEAVLGKNWIKFDKEGGKSQEIISLGIMKKKQPQKTGMLMMHISLDQFKESIEELKLDPNLEFLAMDLQDKIIINFNFSGESIEDLKEIKKINLMKLILGKIEYLHFQFMQIKDHPIKIYYSYKLRGSVFDVEITKVFFFMSLLIILLLVIFYLMIYCDIKKAIKVTSFEYSDNYQYSTKEMKIIAKKTFCYAKNLEDCKKQKAILAKKNIMLKEMMESYISERKNKKNNSC